jgi:ribonucleoside-diphosphate reductase alpha chain
VNGDVPVTILRPAPPALALTDGAHYMLRFRYLARGADGTFEEPVELFRRVAWYLAEAERRFQPGLSAAAVADWADRFLDIMVSLRYLPNAPTLLGAGRPPEQLCACFVLPVEDSIGGIFDALRRAAVVHARGGGTGFSFSRLRPRGAPIASGGTASGPVAFLRVFDAETDVVKAGGTGWGANMGVLRCDHPDVGEFVRAKAAPGTLPNFNLSVGVTDAFMAASATGADWALVDPLSGRWTAEVPARELLTLMAEHAWATGDPGLLFLDRIAADNPTPALGPIEATNPCGEAPLLPYEACCLGGVNVARFAGPDGVRWADLEATAALALRLMDNVLEAGRFPLPEIEAATRRTRKVGIGVMGFADLLIALGVPYDSPAAVALAREVMRTVQEATREASIRLAEERGSFPAFPDSRWAARGLRRLRNAATTSNAPNSTIGVIAGCSPGIEPLFAVGFERHLASGERLAELHPHFVTESTRRGLASDALFASVRQRGSIRGLAGVPADLQRVFATAHDVAPEWHVRVQAAFQAHTDLGVSKTINLPHDVRPEAIADVFRLAHALGCKGITCYRDGCRETQFLVAGGGTGATPAPCPTCA